MERTRWLAAWVAMAGLVTPGGCRVIDRVEWDPITFLDSPITLAADPATIDAVTVTNDTLRFRVTHAGGLEEHSFSLYGFGFLESHPVQVNVVLAHDARGDAGEARIVRELAFDLAPLGRAYRDAYARGGPILLRIHEPGSSTPRTVVRYEHGEGRR